MPHILDYHGPKVFQTNFEPEVTANQVLNPALGALLALKFEGSAAWSLVQSVPEPIAGVPGGKMLAARRKIDVMGQPRSIVLTIEVAPATPGGTVARFSFVAGDHWAFQSIEYEVDLAISTMARALQTRFAHAGWQMLQGGWAKPHSFQAQKTDGTYRLGEVWFLPGGGTRRIGVEPTQNADVLFDNIRTGRVFFRQLWGVRRDEIHDAICACIRANLAIADEEPIWLERVSQNCFVTPETAPMHVRVLSGDVWNGVSVSVAFAGVNGLSDDQAALASGILVGLGQTIPLLADQPGLLGPVLHSFQRDLFTFSKTSIHFGLWVPEAMADTTTECVGNVLAEHFDLLQGRWTGPDLNSFFGGSRADPGLCLHGTIRDVPAGLWIGLSFATSSRWGDAVVAAALLNAVAGIDGALDTLQPGLALVQGAVDWTFGLTAPQPTESFARIRTILDPDWTYADLTFPPRRSTEMVLSGFGSSEGEGTIVFDLRASVIVEGTLTVTLRVRDGAYLDVTSTDAAVERLIAAFRASLDVTPGSFAANPPSRISLDVMVSGG